MNIIPVSVYQSTLCEDEFMKRKIFLPMLALILTLSCSVPSGRGRAQPADTPVPIASVEIPTVDGPDKLKIPAGIQPGKVLRLRGKGVPRLRGSGRGDQLVVVNVEVPKALTAEQRVLFEQLARSLGSDVRPAERSFLDWLKETLGG